MTTHREVVILPLQSLGPCYQALHSGGAVLAAQNLKAIDHLGLDRCSLHCFCACRVRTLKVVGTAGTCGNRWEHLSNYGILTLLRQEFCATACLPVYPAADQACYLQPPPANVTPGVDDEWNQGKRGEGQRGRSVGGYSPDSSPRVSGSPSTRYIRCRRPHLCMLYFCLSYRLSLMLWCRSSTRLRSKM